MQFKGFLRGRVCISLCLFGFFALSSAALRADDIAYMGVVGGNFGTIDLSTGAFSLLGNSGQTLAGMAVADVTLFGSSYHQSTGTLYSVNPTNGALTVIGSSAVDIDDFGSTTSGLFTIGTDGNLYSVNPNTGAESLIGATGFGPGGIGFGAWRSLSTNSNVLYFANATNLYSIDTNTGASTLIGSMGTAYIGAMVFEDNTLYGGENTPGFNVDTLNVSTGAATEGAAVSGSGAGDFFALAPNPLPLNETPEPATWTLLVTGLLAIGMLRLRRRALA